MSWKILFFFIYVDEEDCKENTMEALTERSALAHTMLICMRLLSFLSAPYAF